MGKTFYFDSIGLNLAGVAGDGYVDALNAWKTSGTPPATSDEIRLIDNSTDEGVSYTNGELDTTYKAGVKIATAALKDVDFFAINLPSALTQTVKLYGSESETTGYIELVSIATPSAGWTVVQFASDNLRYFVVQVESGSTFSAVLIDEAVIGERYDFAELWNVGGSEGEKFGIKIEESAGGIEYSFKFHNAKGEWDNGWMITAAQKTVLEAFRDALDGNFLKFVYSEDGATGPFHFVRLTKNSLKFKNVDGARFSTSVGLRGQLS